MGGMLGFYYRQLAFTPKPLPKTVRLDGKTAIITGANAGLGLEASKELASHGLSRLILAVRSLDRGEAAKQEILGQSPTCDIQVWQLDMEAYRSIVTFSERAKSLDRVDLVILCAGVKNLKFQRSKAGHESNVQVNHLGTALLSLLLLKPLAATARTNRALSRLTIVTSEVHFWTPFHERNAPSILARMDQEDSFKGMERYNTSKLLNVLWTQELSSKVDSALVTINCVNPGFCASSLHRSDNTPGLAFLTKIFGWSSQQGGHCITDASVLHAENHGAYLSEQKLTSPSNFVISQEGKTAQNRIWAETIGEYGEKVAGFDEHACLEL